MNTGDIRILDVGGANAAPTYPQSGTLKWVTAAGNTALKPGEFCKIAATGGTSNVVVIADADGTTGSRLVGLVASTDSVTTSANGVVDVYLPLPGIVYAAKAKTATAADTDAEILALIGKRVILDVTSSKQTVDTAAADAVTNAICIVGGDSSTSTIYFTINPQATLIGGIL